MFASFDKMPHRGKQRQVKNMKDQWPQAVTKAHVVCVKRHDHNAAESKTSCLVTSLPCMQRRRCPKVLSGQHTSKGRIKAAAHAKDGDCFVCLVIPLNTESKIQ